MAKKLNLADLTGKHLIDCTIPHENVYKVTKVSVEADFIWIEPTEKYRNMLSPKIYEGRLFRSLVRKGRIVLN